MYIKVAKAGKDAYTSTNPNDFIFHSGYNTFKIITEGLLSNQTVDANPKTFTVAHNQSYTPNIYAFAKFPDGKTTTPGSWDYTLQPDVSGGYGKFDAEVDATNMYFIFTKPASNYNVNIKYYVFEVSI